MDAFEVACVDAAFRERPPVAQFRLGYDEQRYAEIVDRCRRS